MRKIPADLSALLKTGLTRSLTSLLIKVATAGLTYLAFVVLSRTMTAMRGRVSAVNALFIGTSNQIGEFESGVTAAWFGTVPAVLIGGIGTLLIVTIWIKAFPMLYRFDTFEKHYKQ